MSADDRNGARRTLDVLEALTGYAATGATNGDLAQATRATPTQITRAMADLIDKGWGRKDEDTGRFYPTTSFTRLTFRVLNDFERAETRIADLKRSMTGH